MLLDSSADCLGHPFERPLTLAEIDSKFEATKNGASSKSFILLASQTSSNWNQVTTWLYRLNSLRQAEALPRDLVDERAANSENYTAIDIPYIG